MANKAFKFRLYPSVLQEQLIIKTFGCCRFIYNKMLADRKSHYEQFHEALKNTPAQYTVLVENIFSGTKMQLKI